MMRHRLACVFLLLVVAQAAGQPAATEHVTVTGTRSREVTDAFVRAFAAPARMTGKLARWEEGVCPTTVGLKPQFAAFISRHLRDVAGQVGAPVNARKSCTPNIEIVFTTAPQRLLDNVALHHRQYLGYADNSAQRAALATVSHPIQAWYTLATKDLRGKTQIDSPGGQGTGEPSNIMGDTSQLEFAASSVTGSRLSNGLRSALYHVIIVADPDKLLDHQIGSLADYIAMLALAQIPSLDACQQLPSIVNLLATGCANASNDLTGNDLSYLSGLYRMRADAKLGVQRDQISYQMQHSSLEGADARPDAKR